MLDTCKNCGHTILVEYQSTDNGFRPVYYDGDNPRDMRTTLTCNNCGNFLPGNERRDHNTMNIEEIIGNTSGARHIELSEAFLNKLISGNGSKHRVVIHEGYFVLNTGNGIEVHLAYHSHCMDTDISITFKVLQVKPFYYMYGLPMIDKKFPFLAYKKGTYSERFITCTLNQIPGIEGRLRQYRQNIRSGDVEFRKGRIIITLNRKEDTQNVQNTVS